MAVAEHPYKGSMSFLFLLASGLLTFYAGMGGPHTSTAGVVLLTAIVLWMARPILGAVPDIYRGSQSAHEFERVLDRWSRANRDLLRSFERLGSLRYFLSGLVARAPTSASIGITGMLISEAKSDTEIVVAAVLTRGTVIGVVAATVIAGLKAGFNTWRLRRVRIVEGGKDANCQSG
jgi:hypothetical protein